MQLNSFLKKSRHGVYYLRIQRGGIDRRVSLRTRDPKIAAAAAYRFGSAMTKPLPSASDIDAAFVRMLLEPKPTQPPPQDATALLQQLVHLLTAAQLQQPMAALPVAPTLKPICLRDAFQEYLPALDKTKGAKKTKGMAKSALEKLVLFIGADFDMSLFDDDAVETGWMLKRKAEKSNRRKLVDGVMVEKDIAWTTIEKELSWVRAFSAWAANNKQKYCPSVLTLTIPDGEGESEHYDYLNAEDLRRIFDALPAAAHEPWQFWLPIIGLFTGARIGEPAALRVDHFFEKIGLSVMHLPGTKTLCAPRDVPIHPHLVEIGLLNLVASRRAAGKKTLFDITVSEHNGAGGAPSTWFGRLLDDLGIVERGKVFHSFRHTLVDHLKQACSPKEARMQYVGHKDGSGNSSHDMYGRNALGLPILQAEVIDKIDWQKYCGWSPDLDRLRVAAARFINL